MICGHGFSHFVSNLFCYSADIIGGFTLMKQPRHVQSQSADCDNRKQASREKLANADLKKKKNADVIMDE